MNIQPTRIFNKILTKRAECGQQTLFYFNSLNRISLVMKMTIKSYFPNTFNQQDFWSTIVFSSSDTTYEINLKKYLFSFGSMVQNGKFEAAAALFVKTLKNVDFPTLGTPTMPTRRLVPTRPINGFRSGSSTFFGGILKT